jgi:hypothetical protein
MIPPTPRTLLLGAQNAGFFSNLNSVLNHLRYSLGRNGIEALLVDWRANPTERNEFSYGRAEDGNLWLRFFEPPAFEHHPPPLSVTRFYANGAMTSRRAYAMYKFGWRWRRIYNRLFRRYIAVRPALLARAEAIHARNMAGHYRIGVHCRHPKHDSECLHRSPSLARYIAMTRSLLPSGHSWVVFLASDYEPAVAAFRAVFGERLVMQEGVRRASAPNAAQRHHIDPDPAIASGEQVLIDALLLARCDAVVHVTSNLATAVGYMNPDSRMVYCETRLQALIGYLWSLYQYTPLAVWRGRLVRAVAARRQKVVPRVS